MSSFPPHKLGPSLPVPQETALKFLTTYLSATKTSPHLLPNARLDPSGPTAGTSNSSLIIHNLERVAAGLRGEWLAPILEFEDLENRKKGENEFEVMDGMDDGRNKGQDTGGEKVEEGWMDLEDYQREQSIEGANIRAEDGDSETEENTEVYAGDDQVGEKDPREVEGDDGEGEGEDEMEVEKKAEKKRKKSLKDEEKAGKSAILPPAKKAKTSKPILPPTKKVVTTSDKEAKKAEKKARLKAEKMARELAKQNK